MVSSKLARAIARAAEDTTMPGGGIDPAAQSIAMQMKDFHPGRAPKPGALDRHVAGQQQMGYTR